MADVLGVAAVGADWRCGGGLSCATTGAHSRGWLCMLVAARGCLWLCFVCRCRAACLHCARACAVALLLSRLPEC